MMSLKNFIYLLLAISAVDSGVAKQRLRTPKFEDLRNKAFNPKLSDRIKGKSLQQLGVKPESAIRQGRRRQESEGPFLKFFAVYEEFGPSPLTTLGQSAGLNGYLFDYSKYGSDLYEDDIIGALRGTCSVVGSRASGEDHFCTYEILIIADGEEGFGTVIASGSLTYAVEDGGYLIVEALGNDLEHQEQGGILTLTYKATGENNVIVGELQLS